MSAIPPPARTVDRLTQRQWFAGQALPGVIAARVGAGVDWDQESIAEECYELADAMLAEDQRVEGDEG